LGRQLRREGIVVNDKKIRRIQREYQLFPIRWHSFKIASTDSNHGYKIYPNLLRGKTLTGINQVWVADIPYIRILTGFVFLAAISWIDIPVRSSVGRFPNESMPSWAWQL
jgi:putative transposase